MLHETGGGATRPAGATNNVLKLTPNFRMSKEKVIGCLFAF